MNSLTESEKQKDKTFVKETKTKIEYHVEELNWFLSLNKEDSSAVFQYKNGSERKPSGSEVLLFLNNYKTNLILDLMPNNQKEIN